MISKKKQIERDNALEVLKEANMAEKMAFLDRQQALKEFIEVFSTDKVLNPNIKEEEDELDPSFRREVDPESPEAQSILEKADKV